jgi:rubredoxin
MEDNKPQTKRCTKCGEVKPVAEFHKAKREKDGFQYWCKKCKHEYDVNNISNRVYIYENGMKICSKCGIQKPIVDFYKINSRTERRHPKCKECTLEHQKKYNKENSEKISKRNKLYREKNSDVIKKRKKEYYDANAPMLNQKSKEFRLSHQEELSEYRKEYYKKNRDVILEKCKKYREDHPDEKKARGKQYYLDNSEDIKAYQKWYSKTPRGKIVASRHDHRRRDRTKRVPNTLTLEEWEFIVASQNNRCSICGREFVKELPPTRDHIIPLAKGGGLTFDNVQALCRSCNGKKQDKIYPKDVYINGYDINGCDISGCDIK